MPAPRTTPETLPAIREGLAVARGSGLSFDDAWALIVGPVGDPGSVLLQMHPSARCGWRPVLDETREAWRAAYERRPACSSDPLWGLRGAEVGQGSSVTFAAPSVVLPVGGTT